MVLRSARFQHVEVFGLEIGQAALIGGIKRVHEAIAEGIGIDVERRMHEVRDIGPEGFISVHELKRVAQRLGLHRHPQRVDVVGRQLSFAAGGVEFAFKVVKRDLAHDGVDHILDLTRKQGLFLGLGLGIVEQAAEGQHLAKDRGGFGQG